MKRNIIVFHDNGEGQRGYTEYTPDEITAIGGIESLRSDYAANGIVVYAIIAE